MAGHFIFMVLHYPTHEHRDDLARSMSEMGRFLRDKPGCIAVEPPYLTEDGGCVVGLSKWESREAFDAVGIELLPSEHVPEGEVRPRQRFLLHEVSGLSV